MSTPVDLLDRPVYGMGEVDRLLLLHSGTAQRWIDGYTRNGRTYPPLVRHQPTGSDIVTWGEFVETRLLAEYRDKGVPLYRMRPAIERLREQFQTKYPLAHAKPFAAGKELVLAVQEEVGLESPLRLVVIRNGQCVLSSSASHFVDSAEFDDSAVGIVTRIWPLEGSRTVVMDPLRQFGAPVVRTVPTDVIAEQVRAGDRMEMIAELYELSIDEVEAAVRYELTRAADVA
jgi:uncharacterized protein (DUF433 family)